MCSKNKVSDVILICSFTYLGIIRIIFLADRVNESGPLKQATELENDETKLNVEKIYVI